jgi:hypothetical protein
MFLKNVMVGLACLRRDILRAQAGQPKHRKTYHSSSVVNSTTCACVHMSVVPPCCRDILRAQAGLAEHHDNYHEFCRLLGRLKTNYQLSELVSVDGLEIY